MDVLARLNHTPSKQKSTEAWYYSPFHAENTPSFKVNTVENIWYDFSISKGGNVISLVMELYNYTFPEAMKELAKITGKNFQSNNKNKVVIPSKKRKKAEEIKPKENPIRKVLTLQNPALIEYLQSRKINITIAKHYLKEIHYTANNNSFFALGFINDSGAYELRNKQFKGGLKGMPKDITTLTSIAPQRNQDVLLFFEGFMDFFSLFSVNYYLSIIKICIFDKFY